ncbi:T6SS immunity protein Tli3 family protein [Caballeronia glebae]
MLPYDAPPQVIYRIDDHRFITLEHYRDCNHGDTYYNDSKASIRTYLGRGGIENYQGQLIVSDPSEKNVVIPSSAPPNFACSDRGCSVSLIYSTDGGRTFSGTDFMRSFDPFTDTRRYAVLVTSDAYYVEKKRQYDSYVNRFPLVPGFKYGRDTLPLNNRIQFDVKVPIGLRSPSGQERFSCNASIRPTNPEAPLK